MADRFSGNVQIGGKISSELLEQVDKLLLKQGITEQELDMSGYAWFNECVSEDMQELIAFCKDNCIPLSIQWDAKYEYGGYVQFFIADQEKTFLCTNEGQIVVSVADMQEHQGMTVKEYIDRLAIPSIPALEIIDSEYLIKSVKHSETFAGTRNDAIVRAREIDAEYSPAFGVQIENSSGETVWDSEEAAYDAQHE